jgi:hypothetical protein
MDHHKAKFSLGCLGEESLVVEAEDVDGGDGDVGSIEGLLNPERPNKSDVEIMDVYMSDALNSTEG